MLDMTTSRPYRMIASARYWNNLVLGLIGCTIENGDEITGARVVDKSANGGRTMFRIELWLRTKDIGVRTQLRCDGMVRWLGGHAELTHNVDNFSTSRPHHSTYRDSMIEVMTDGDSNKASQLQGDFQWKMHGV